MIAGASISYWIAFHVLVAVLLVVDLAFLHRGKHSTRLRNAWAWTIFLVTLACGCALFLSKTQGREPGLEFFSGYLIEGSLSVDNLFVFLLMFRSLRLCAETSPRGVVWGGVGPL